MNVVKRFFARVDVSEFCCSRNCGDVNNRPTMKSKQQIEFGDFQTPGDLAAEVCRVLKRRRVAPMSIVEPTCGVGQFLEAALNTFPNAVQACGMELNPVHLRKARKRIGPRASQVRLRQADFFQTNWGQILDSLPEPILVVGNPPWVCNSELGAIRGANLPKKTNASGSRGIDAITGKSNFDVSEWMISRLFDALRGKTATLAMLCKTSVARKVLAQAWRDDMPLKRATMHRIDSHKTFGVAVDACLLAADFGSTLGQQECQVFERLDSQASHSSFGWRDERLVADIAAYDQWSPYLTGSPLRWRSGIKHDCSKVMELRREGRRFRNGLGELVDLELDYLYPMLKSSEIASKGNATPTRWMLVPQRSVGEDTAAIQRLAPKTWRYLQRNRERLDRRASSIYRGRPPFSIFGIGPYAFAPWKVAISGLYKELSFRLLGSHEEKPIVLDDTCYALPFESQANAGEYCDVLNSGTSQAAINSLIFWDSKRPITANVLNLFDARSVANLVPEKQVA